MIYAITGMDFIIKSFIQVNLLILEDYTIVQQKSRWLVEFKDDSLLKSKGDAKGYNQGTVSSLPVGRNAILVSALTSYVW